MPSADKENLTELSSGQLIAGDPHLHDGYSGVQHCAGVSYGSWGLGRRLTKPLNTVCIRYCPPCRLVGDGYRRLWRRVTSRVQLMLLRSFPLDAPTSWRMLPPATAEVSSAPLASAVALLAVSSFL